MSDCRSLKRHSRARSGLGWLGFVVLISLLARDEMARAQSDFELPDMDWPGLQVEATAGLGGMVNLSTPLPLSFLLRNDTDRNLEGVMSLYLPSKGEQVSLGEVVIGPHSVKRFTSIQVISDWNDCRIMLTSGGKILWRRELDLQLEKPFNRNVNYALFVDASGRNLALSSAAAASSLEHDESIAGREGRVVRCLTSKPWQIPNHPAPMIIIQALIFPENTVERDLNQTQWKAVAQWICQGGMLFVHKSSPEVFARLLELAPFQPESTFESGPFQVRRLGLGGIYEYAEPLMSSNDSGVKESIADLLAGRGRNQLYRFPDAHYFFNVERGQQFDKNRLLMYGLFAIYALISGGGALMLFRLNQKQITTFAVITVALASVAAGVLGGYLRMSKGDATWMSVTYAGAGGLVQASAIDVQSAGSRNTRLAVSGDDADLQILSIKNGSFNYYGVARQIGYSPFTWQPNLLPTETEKYQIQVTMAPWGSRRCHATAYVREPRRLQVDLDFIADIEAANASDQTADRISKKPSMGPRGKVRLKVENGLPFALTEVQLVIGVTCMLTAQEKSAFQNSNQRNLYGRQNRSATVDDLIDTYHFERLADLAGNSKIESEFPATFLSAETHAESQFWRHYGFEFPPRISQMGHSKIWIMAKLNQSPSLEIDEERSDFIPVDGNHFFVQELFPEEVPETLRKVFSKENQNSDSKSPSES